MWWIGLVMAEEPTVRDQVDETERAVLNDERQKVDALHHRIQRLEEELSMQTDFVQQDGVIIAALSTLVDSRVPTQERIVAIEQLASLQTELALPFLWEMVAEDEAMTVAIVQALPKFVTPDSSDQTVLACRDIVRKALSVSEVKPSTFTVAIGHTELIGSLNGESQINVRVAKAALGAIKQISNPQMAELLIEYVSDEQAPIELREESLIHLQNAYGDWLKNKEVPTITTPNNRLANQLYAVSAGVTGSVLLGSVGVWGQNPTSEAIGYTGGALLGATSGWLISQQQHPTLAQSVLMSSSTGWGLAMGEMLSNGWNLNPEYAALSRTIGVMAGSGYGHWARNRNMSLSDVLEADFMGYVGAQTAVGLLDATTDQSTLQYPEWDDYYESTTTSSREQDIAYQEAYNAYAEGNEQHERKKMLVATAGSAVGLGLSHVLMEDWTPTPKSVLFAGVWSGQMGIATAELLPSIGMQYPQGWVRLASHASMVGALYYDHRNPVSYEQSIFSAYGAGVGYLLGYGSNSLRRGSYEDGRRNAAVLSTLGALGGTSLGNSLDFGTSDWVTTGVGMGVATWHMNSISKIARQNKWLTWRQAEGLYQTGLGVTALGLIGAGQYFDVSSSDAIFLGSATGWGAYYGALAPLALGVDDQWSSTDKLLTTLLISDLFLAAGSYGLISQQIESEKTAVPQMLGLAGATVGSLGAFLFTDSSQVVSGAALLGATVGLGSGVLLNNRNVDVSMNLDRGHNRVWDGLNVQTSPYVDENGDMGLFVGLSN